MSVTEERIAENEARFREANEEIRHSADDLGFAAPIPFICECGDARCREILRLPRDAYEAVRAKPTYFFVVYGHQDVAGPSGRVVSTERTHVVVEKVGDAGAVARERDPRSAG